MGITDQYAELWKAIIRPPRDRYETKDLGPKRFRIAGQVVVMGEPFGGGGLLAAGSLTEREMSTAGWNCSSRIEGISTLPVLLPFGITLFTFDFAGSGRSDGEYVSLGYFEKDDLACVVEHLRATGTVSTIGLWGRSMGAVTALLHGDRDPSIAGMVLDSPFQDLRIVAEELVVEFGGFRVPKFVVNIAMSMIRNSIKSRADFDINDLVPIKHVDRTFIPALFAAAEGDTFIKPHHARALYNAYAGDKNLITVEGDHNSVRPKFFTDSVAIFFFNTLQCAQLVGVSHAPTAPHIPDRSHSLPTAMPHRRRGSNNRENQRSGGSGQPLGLDMVPPTQASFDNYGLPQSEDEEEMMMQQAIALSLQQQHSQKDQPPDEPEAPSSRRESSISSPPQDADLLHLNSIDSVDTVPVSQLIDELAATARPTEEKNENSDESPAESIKDPEKNP
ncbi:hypothetical protein FOL47_002590 [Perkinsus chesapeaki]|uniref:Serine aminopeptidase S33 domain-containing protein n=1 Tax=Perkinsus chesapeaki TaxID=330153 RepID=A0A7J6MCP6_PERCH|nr:hypothetical protein FOL47_002590 [Perkinsus chesapeaki]